MEIPPSDTSEDSEQTSRARRRRAQRRLLQSLSEDERASYLEEVAHRAAPSFDFFLFSLFSSAIISFGLLIDSPYALLLGAVLAPLMAPAVGISLGAVIGSSKTFFRSLGGLLVACFLVILVGALTGVAARIWLPMELLQAHLHTQLTWPPFLVIGAAAVLTASTIAKDRFAAIPSVILAYGFYVPLSAAGFGLGSGVPHLWINGLVLFLIHLSWATLIGVGTLAVMGFRPYTLFGYSLSGALLLVVVLLVIGFGGAGAVVGGQVALPTATITPTLTLSPTTTLTPSPIPPTETHTPTLTPVPPTETLTPTQTRTPTTTPIEARVQVQGEFTGAVLRDAPNGNAFYSMVNGWLVEILPDEPVVLNGAVWVHVLDLENEVDGWIRQSLLVTATSSVPTNTPTITETITPTSAPATGTATSSPTEAPQPASATPTP